ncbi:MAG: hypothetical protein BHV69_09675 [Bacteroidales bacterium 52_46]|nr:MAG: hypothetical protein BHV69_09675 [Bacteroidales bacterium 52_46]
MANYRFKTAEIEAMKKNILTHIEHETETKTAWRLRCAIEGQLMCCRPSKREAARLERELALYERLTKNDLPNWQSKPIQPSTPAETPRISKETAETVNVSAEGEKEAQRAKNKPTFADVAQMVKTELAKNKAMRTAWHLEFPDGTECDVRYKLTAVGCDFYEYTETRNGEEAFKDYKATECDITFYICQRLGIDAIEPPQSTETPKMGECTAESCKLAQTA